MKEWRNNIETSALSDKPCGHQIHARTDVEISGYSHCVKYLKEELC